MLFSVLIALATVFLLLGFALARPALVTGDSPAFPVNDAGLSAYIKLDPNTGDFANTGLDRIIKAVFTDLVAAGDNYIIGRLPVNQAKWGTSKVNVQSYVDKDAWVVAYLKSGDKAANIFAWTKWNTSSPKLDTVLEEALQKTASVVGQTIDSKKIVWYDWAHPEATHLSAAARYGVGKTFIAIPEAATVYGKPSYSWNTQSVRVQAHIILNRTGQLTLTKLGGPAQTLESGRTTNVFSVKEVVMDMGVIYTFDASFDGPAIQPEVGTNHLIGVAVVYKAPTP